MKSQSVDWFISNFESNDNMLKAAMLILPEHQHRNCIIAFKKYCEINPDRVQKMFQRLKNSRHGSNLITNLSKKA